MRGKNPVALIRLPHLLLAALAGLVVFGAIALPALTRANDLPLAAGSPLTGVAFDDRPLILPVQRNFQMAMLTASSQIGRSCGRMESYGWRTAQTEQHRVDLIFSNTVSRLRGLGYTVEAQTPSSISKDITLFTADRPDKHFLFMWSAGEIGLVMVVCESSGPPTGRVASLYNTPPSAATTLPQEVLQSKLAPAPAGKAHKAAETFTPVGDWVGDYTCMRGYTGATMHIDTFKGEDFRGTFRFYPTTKNAYIPKGSYAIYGQYDKQSKRILINPGSWIEHPKGYYKTIIVGSFDPEARTFSGFFQGIMGCTSFEARANVKSKEVSGKKSAAKHTTPKKKVAAKKKAAPAPAAAAPATPEESIVPEPAPENAPAPATPATPAPAATPPAAAPAPAPTPAPAAAPSPDAASHASPAPAAPAPAPTPAAPAAAAPLPLTPVAPPAAAPATPPAAAPAPTPTSALDRKYGQHLIVLAGDWPATPSAPQLPPATYYNTTVPQIARAPDYLTQAPQTQPAQRYPTDITQLPPAPIYPTTVPPLPQQTNYNTNVPPIARAPDYLTQAPQTQPAQPYNTNVPLLPTAPSYMIYTAPGS